MIFMITCSPSSLIDIKEFCYSPFNSLCMMFDFINYDTDLRALKIIYLEWFALEKVENP